LLKTKDWAAKVRCPMLSRFPIGILYSLEVI
jgi:hypothetical protein